jgi:hypothetical protein
MAGTENFVVYGLLPRRGSVIQGGGCIVGVVFFGRWIASPPILSGQAVPPRNDGS